MIDTDTLIKEQEERLGRSLTDQEKQAIEGLQMILGAIWKGRSSIKEISA